MRRQKMMIFIEIFMIFQLIANVKTMNNNHDKEIIIIGAGFAGIAAGAKLMENNFNNIKILEAENRIGGRIHSIDFGGDDKKIDLGGQWVHGENDNIIYEMSKDHFEFESTPFNQTFFISDGKTPFNQDDANKLVMLAYLITDESSDEFENFNGSLGEFFNEKYEEALNLPEYKSIDKKLAQLVKENVERQQNAFYASESWFDVSGKLYNQLPNSEGDQQICWKDKGYIKAVDFITKKLPNPTEHIDILSKIELNKEVVNINYSQSLDGKISIKCSDGYQYAADHVIVTVSLGVLKAQHEKLFTPQLSDEKKFLIEKYAYGAVGKIFLEFEDIFWKDLFQATSFLWLQDDIDEVKALHKEWLLDVTSFLQVVSFPNLLEIFVAGTHVNTFEQLSDDQLINDIMWCLEKFLNQKLPKPISMVRTYWKSNKHFNGAYSYINVDIEKLNRGPNFMKVLAEPIGNLHFAGEAIDFKYPGYAHGAVNSGYRAAYEIIN